MVYRLFLILIPVSAFGDADATNMMVHLTLCSPRTPGRGLTCLSSKIRLSGHVGVHDALRVDLEDEHYLAQVTDIVVSSHLAMIVALAEPVISHSTVERMQDLGWVESPYMESESGELVGVLLPYPVEEMVHTEHWVPFEEGDWEVLRNPGVRESLPLATVLSDDERFVDSVPSLAAWRQRKTSQEATLC